MIKIAENKKNKTKQNSRKPYQYNNIYSATPSVGFGMSSKSNFPHNTLSPPPADVLQAIL